MTRKSNFELIRIIAMLLIVSCHYSVHGAWGFNPGYNEKKFLIQSLSLGGQVGVGLFILITGYFSNGTSIKWYNIGNIYFKAWFYSIIIGVVFFIFSNNISIFRLIKSVAYPNYWFINTYLYLLLISPFLNILTSNINKLQFVFMISIMTIMLYLPKLNSPTGDLFLFIYVYFIGRFIKEYFDDVVFSKVWLAFFGGASFLFILGSILLFEMLEFGNELIFTERKSPFVLIISLVLFLWFKRFDFKSEIINKISGSMFGVYILHDNQLIRPFLWGSLLDNKNFLNSDFIFLHFLFSVIVIFLISIIVDILISPVINVFYRLISGFFSKIWSRHFQYGNSSKYF